MSIRIKKKKRAEQIDCEFNNITMQPSSLLSQAKQSASLSWWCDGVKKKKTKVNQSELIVQITGKINVSGFLGFGFAKDATF